MSTGRRLRVQFAHGARYDGTIIDFDPTNPPQNFGRPTLERQAGFPFQLEDTITFLGVRFCRRVALGAHFREILTRYQHQRGNLSRRAGQSLGLDASVLRITHNAVVSSLVRYGLLVIGSCIPDDLANKIRADLIVCG